MSATTPTERTSSGSPLGSRELAAWRGFLRAHSALTKQLDADLVAEHGLSLSSYEVLLHLGTANGGRARMSTLAGSTLLSRSGMTRLVDRLEREGLVERRECPTDARGLEAVITDRGRKRFERARRTHLAGVRRLYLELLSQEDQRTLAEIWERVAPGATAE